MFKHKIRGSFRADEDTQSNPCIVYSMYIMTFGILNYKKSNDFGKSTRLGMKQSLDIKW